MEYLKSKNSHFIYLIVFSLVAFSFIIVAAVSTFYTSKASDIKREQVKLLRANIALKKSIENKQNEYESIRDKIEDIESFVQQKYGQKKSDVAKLLSSLSNNYKKLIVDSIPSGYPSISRRITSTFGYRVHPIYGKKRFHHGVDFGGKMGTSIIATADGIVEFSGFDRGYGNLVVIHHNFGFKTAYGHMRKKLMVKKGDFVKKGDIIGYLGSSGISTGPHLHYEVKYVKNTLNPKNFLNFKMDNFDTLFYTENHIAWDSLVSAILNQYGRVGLARLL